MDNFQSISDALHGILASTSEDGGKLSKAVEGFLDSDDVNVQIAVCEVILEVVSEGSQETQQQRRTLLFEDSALTYIPILLRLTNKAPELAPNLVNLIAAYGQPREVVMALSEGLQYVIDRAEGFGVSDHEGGEEEEEDADDAMEAVTEWLVIITSLASALPRLPNVRSTPTLLSLSEVLSPSIAAISRHAGVDMACSCLMVMCRFVEIAWGWVQRTTDKGGEQASLLSNVLFESITHFGSRVEARLTERWFLATFPKYGGPQTSTEISEETWSRGALTLQRALMTAQKLSPTPPLFERVVYSSSRSTNGTFAAFNALASTIPLNQLDKLLPNPLPATMLGDSMPVICAALSGTSVDAGAAWVWWMVHRVMTTEKDGKPELVIDYDEATMLIELLVPLTAQHHSATMRLALFKLIGGLVSILSGLDKVLALKQLLEPENPFDAVRIESLSLLREETSHSTDLISPDLLPHLSPTLFALPVPTDPDSPFNIPPPTLLSTPHPTWWTECANYLWFLATCDKNDVSGVKSKHRGELVVWVDSVGKKLKEVEAFVKEQEGDVKTAEVKEGQGVELLLARWADALKRAKEALHV
ncbi:hypothetical protein IAT38_001412 [Cryptococcus sp. DSM 104549]